MKKTLKEEYVYIIAALMISLYVCINEHLKGYLSICQIYFTMSVKCYENPVCSV